MNWNDFRIFAVAADTRSLTEAARTLRVSTATVSRRLDSLENDLGLRLLDRSPEGISVTAHGKALLARGAPAVEAMADADRLSAVLRGGGWTEPIRVTATEAVVVEVLAPALPLLFKALPGIRIDLSSDAGLVSIAARKADIAVRMSRPIGNGLLTRRLAKITLGLYAAPSYLRGRAPETLALTSERLIGYDESFGPIPETTWFENFGLGGALAVRMSSARATIEAARAGAGIALLPDLLARRHADLVAIPTNNERPIREAWLVSHRDFRNVALFKAVRNWVIEAFRLEPGETSECDGS